jgi:hypothetical protein
MNARHREETIFTAWLSSLFMPFAQRAHWNGDVSMTFGDCARGMPVWLKESKIGKIIFHCEFDVDPSQSFRTWVDARDFCMMGFAIFGQTRHIDESGSRVLAPCGDRT